MNDRWHMRYVFPPLAEPAGQRVITREGKRGKLESITVVGTRLAYEVLLDDGDRATVFATDLDLEIQGGMKPSPVDDEGL
jgi:hypothetical protein